MKKIGRPKKEQKKELFLKMDVKMWEKLDKLKKEKGINKAFAVEKALEKYFKEVE